MLLYHLKHFSKKESWMSHQDNKDVAISLQTLKEVFDWLLPDCAKVPRHGNAKISSFVLAETAIACWGCSTQRTLTQRVREAASRGASSIPSADRTYAARGLRRPRKLRRTTRRRGEKAYLFATATAKRPLDHRWQAYLRRRWIEICRTSHRPESGRVRGTLRPR